MKIEIADSYLPVFQALASSVRLKMIELLADRPMNIKELAAELGLSSPILLMHADKLEKAGIIAFKRVQGKGGGIQKVCYLITEDIQIAFPKPHKENRKYIDITIPIGHYTDFEATPTCGLATTKNIIGTFDDPRYFLDPERVNAKILWLTQGFFEYKVSNFLLPDQNLEEILISLELGSEAPAVNNNWPSDISFYLNDVKLGQWTSPGDFGGIHGKYTPDWWGVNINQFGLLKVLRIDKQGTFIDGIKLSDKTLDDLELSAKQWTFKIAVEKDAGHIGGLTLYGAGFGNYDQDIQFKLFYTIL